MEQINNRTTIEDVGALASRLYHRRNTTARFRLPMTAEQVRDALLAAVQAEVASRRRTFSLTDVLSEQIERMVPLPTSESSKFAAVLCGGCGNGKTTIAEQRHNLESTDGIWLSNKAFHTWLWFFYLPLCYTIALIFY